MSVMFDSFLGSSGLEPTFSHASTKPASSKGKQEKPAIQPATPETSTHKQAKPDSDGGVSQEALRAAFKAKQDQEREANRRAAPKESTKSSEPSKTTTSSKKPGFMVKVPINVSQLLENLEPSDIVKLMKGMSQGAAVMECIVREAVEQTPDAIIHNFGSDLLKAALDDAEAKKALVARVIEFAPQEAFDAIMDDQKYFEGFSLRTVQKGFDEAIHNSQLHAVANCIVNDEKACRLVIEEILASPAASKALLAALGG